MEKGLITEDGISLDSSFVKGKKANLSFRAMPFKQSIAHLMAFYLNSGHKKACSGTDVVCQ